MKKLLLGAVALVVLAAGPSVAADLATRAPAAYIPPPAAPPPTFTGCYVNGGAGYGLWNIDHFSNPGLGGATSNTTTSGGRGWLGTVGGGCDYQLGSLGGFWSNWVVGAFADYEFMDLHRTLFLSSGDGAGDEKSRQLGQSVDGLVIWSRRMSSRTGMAATLKPVLMGSIFPSRPPTSSRAALAVRRHITAGS